MVEPAQLLQADVRVRQAKEEPLYAWGGIGVGMLGDFMQLGPINSGGLSVPIDDTGKWQPACGHSQDGDATVDAGEADELANAEARQGFELWRSVRNVVTLAAPLRSPSVLSQLLQELRSGHISQDMWKLDESRI